MLYGLSSNGLNNRNTPSKVALLWLKLPNWPIFQHFPTVAICEGKRGRTVKSRRGLGKLGGVDEDLFSRKDPSRSDKNFPSAIQQDLYMRFIIISRPSQDELLKVSTKTGTSPGRSLADAAQWSESIGPSAPGQAVKAAAKLVKRTGRWTSKHVDTVAICGLRLTRSPLSSASGHGWTKLLLHRAVEMILGWNTSWDDLNVATLDTLPCSSSSHVAAARCGPFVLESCAWYRKSWARAGVFWPVFFLSTQSVATPPSSSSSSSPPPPLLSPSCFLAYCFAVRLRVFNHFHLFDPRVFQSGDWTLHQSKCLICSTWSLSHSILVWGKVPLQTLILYHSSARPNWNCPKKRQTDGKEKRIGAIAQTKLTVFMKTLQE